MRATSLKSTATTRRKMNAPVSKVSLSYEQAKALRYVLFDQSMRSAGHLGATLAPPAQALEKLLFSARSFLEGRSEAPAWKTSYTESPASLQRQFCKIERWYNEFNPAFDLLLNHKIPAAFKLFQQCFANTQNVIKPQYPFTMIYVCHQAIRCAFYDKIGRHLSNFFLRHVAELCQVFLGTQHPLSIMSAGLARMDIFDFGLSIGTFLDHYCDYLGPLLGGSEVALGELFGARGMTVSLMEATGMIGFYEARPKLDGLTHKARSRGLTTLHLEIEMASMLHRNKFREEALSLILEVRRSKEAQSSRYDFFYSGIILIQVLRGMKDYEGQITAIRQLADFLAAPRDTDDVTYSSELFMEVRHSSLILVLGMLERVLRNDGRIEEADSVQARSNAIMDDPS
ncbi:hypothetical protein LQW54_000977 [Pestalotiopsis sp. IQ-011]